MQHRSRLLPNCISVNGAERSVGFRQGISYFGLANVKLTGVAQRAKIAVIRPVKRRVRLFGFGVVLAGRWLG
jgi:hypothetical protein